MTGGGLVLSDNPGELQREAELCTDHDTGSERPCKLGDTGGEDVGVGVMLVDPRSSSGIATALRLLSLTPNDVMEDVRQRLRRRAVERMHGWGRLGTVVTEAIHAILR